MSNRSILIRIVPVKRITTMIVTHSKGDAPLSGRFWIPENAGAHVMAEGRPVEPALQPMSPSGMNRRSLHFELAVGAELWIEQEDR